MRTKMASIGLAGLALCFGVNAQQRGGMGSMAAAPMAHPAMMAGPVSVPQMVPAHGVVVAHPTVHRVLPASRVAIPRRVAHPVTGTPTVRSTGSSSTFITTGNAFPGFLGDGGYPVPGLGFDYPHYFATHPNANRRQNSFNGGVFPFVGGGIYLPIPMYEDAGANPAAEQVAETANPETGEPTVEPAEREADVAPRVRVRAESKPTPVSEYVFVKRDGTVFFAVAYSVANAKLQYVTQDGMRRIVPMDALDLDATQQFNEQRGLSFRAPA
jgi:hypothetical protein